MPQIEEADYTARHAACTVRPLPLLLLLFALAGALPWAGPAASAASDPVAPTAPSTSQSSSTGNFVDSALSSLRTLPFIPVPEVSTAPYSGVDVGLIPVVLKETANGEIDQILAPDIYHSSYFGWGATFRLFRYPSADEQWSVIAGTEQRVQRTFDAEWDHGLLRNTPWSWTLHAMYDRSGTGIFYGLGNSSTLKGQSNYIDSQGRLEATAERNLSHRMQIAYLARFSTVTIEQGALPGLPYTATLYPNLNGLGYTREFHQRLTVTYDSRDSVEMPHQGVRLAAFAGASTHVLDSGVAYTAIGFDATKFQPFGNRLTLVAHGALRYMPTYQGAPFWDLSSLGGDRSIIGETQPLRGYGYDRFVGRNSMAASIELRDRVAHLHIMDSNIQFELAPFLDTGKVFSAMAGDPFAHLHAAGGMGFRLIAPPFIVGYVDIGVGSEGPAVFTGINYPF